MDIKQYINGRYLSKIGCLLLAVLLLFILVKLMQMVQYREPIRNNPPLQVLPYKIDAKEAMKLLSPVNTTLLQISKSTYSVIYNRVSKCGSTTVLKMIRKLAKKNGYKHINSREYSKRHIATTDQEELIKSLAGENQPWLYDRHLFFVDFTRSWNTQPVYINLIRDPLDRFISAYYYDRQPTHAHPPNIPPETKNMTLDECVAKELDCCTNPEKSNNLWNITPYFCGQDDLCSKPTTSSLHKAKQNVQRYFAVVGVLDDLEGFFYLLEKNLPSYFANAAKVYNTSFANRKVNAGILKQKPSDTTIQTLKSKMALEYEFYHFIQQRFYNQKFYWTVSSNSV